MNSKKLVLTGLFLAGTLASTVTVWAQAEGILFRARVGESNYCHLRFPAIREDTLGSARPILKDPSSGDIIDFYGPCDYDPTGKEAVRAQKLAEQRRFNRQFNSE